MNYCVDCIYYENDEYGEKCKISIYSESTCPISGIETTLYRNCIDVRSDYMTTRSCAKFQKNPPFASSVIRFVVRFIVGLFSPRK